MNCPECDAVIDVPGDAASGEIVSFLTVEPTMKYQ